MEEVDCLVVGGGVVGLAAARAMALAGREVLLLEAAEAIGTQTSSRNSEVIHAGIYYPEGSLMARSCVEGRRMLYAYCEAKGVPFRNSGKLIVATSEAQADQLPSILERARVNGVEGMRLLSSAQAQALEPNLSCTSALFSETTGIIDSHAYMLALQGDAEAAGATVVLRSPALGGSVTPAGIEMKVGGTEPMQLRCRTLVNSAGLHAPDLARRIDGMPQELVPTQHYAKGNYFTLVGSSPFSRLIYPVPVPGGLGVHFTLDLGGQARFGPDVEWVDEIDYSVDARRAESFSAAVRRYWPDMRNHTLMPGYCGIRPKLSGQGAGAADFMVQGPRSHGVVGLVNLFGIESPGLTASLALGELVRECSLEGARA